MLSFDNPVSELIRQRYSCRTYKKMSIGAEHAAQLEAFTKSIESGPLGTPLRFASIVATEQDRSALRGLGTYGLIRDPGGFIVGAAGRGEKNLEDFGYGLESIVLRATDIDLGTCWLGGNFTKSSFSRKIDATRDETVPAVVATGYAAKETRARDPLRRLAQSDNRRPWETLFFRSIPSQPLSREGAGAYADPLEMLRLAPSSRNYQPWRVIQDGSCYHFHLQRTRGYGPGTAAFVLMSIADLQRVDMGIAMCHFELTATALGLPGKWAVLDPADRGQATGEYVVTWVGENA